MRPLPRVLTALALVITGLLWAPAAAFGHASQVGSSPAEGEMLDAAPSEVRIDYDSALLEIGAALVVRSSDEESITTGPAVVGDRVFSVPVDPSVGPGEYSVAYRVVSQDGHTIENSFTYIVAGDPTPAEVTESATPAAVDDSATPERISEPATPERISEPATPAAVPTPDPVGAPPEGSIMPFILFGGIGLVIVIGIIGAVVLRK